MTTTIEQEGGRVCTTEPMTAEGNHCRCGDSSSRRDRVITKTTAIVAVASSMNIYVNVAIHIHVRISIHVRVAVYVRIPVDTAA